MHRKLQGILTAFIANSGSKAVTGEGSLDEVHSGSLWFTHQEHDSDNACAVGSTFENAQWRKVKPLWPQGRVGHIRNMHSGEK